MSSHLRAAPKVKWLPWLEVFSVLLLVAILCGLFAAVHASNHAPVSPAANAYRVGPKSDAFWSIKVGDVLTLVILAVQLTIFTLQAKYAAGQGEAAREQHRVMQSQAELGKYQTDLMRYQLRAANVSSYAARDAAQAAVRQAVIAERTLSQVEIPYVFVFGVDYLRKPDHFPLVWANIGNYGKTPAVIEEVIGGLAVSLTGRPELPPFDFPNDLITSPVLGGGDVRERVAFHLPDGVECSYYSSPPGIVPHLTPQERLFCFIVIRYRDMFGGRWESCACWLLETENFNRFRPWGHDDYNYIRKISDQKEA